VKKIGISIIVAATLILPGTVYVQAQKGEKLVDNYLKFAEKVMLEKHEAVLQTMQRQQSADNAKKQLKEFYLKELLGAKDNVEQHQKDYILQLEETKEVLKEKDFQKFEQQKAEQLRNEIGQDVEKYLEEILSEK